MVKVIKANGQTEDFSDEKVLDSIKRAGVPFNLQQKVLLEIKQNLRENIPTFEIYQHIIEALAKSDQPLAGAKYSLKQSIMMLGPTGFPFEDFIARVLEEHGYKTQVRQKLMGKCVEHEIDVVAEKGDEKIMVEAKFHNNPGTRSDVRVALYVKSRFDDVAFKHKLTQAWVITNTKTTLDANAYALCSNMNILSWNYPDNNSLRDMVERKKLYPITILNSLNANQKVKLLEQHIVLCKDLHENIDVLSKQNIIQKQRLDIIKELAFITEHQASE